MRGHRNTKNPFAAQFPNPEPLVHNHVNNAYTISLYNCAFRSPASNIDNDYKSKNLFPNPGKALNKNYSLPNFKHHKYLSKELSDANSTNYTNMESNFKCLCPEANMYTQDQDYIKNKECLIFNKFDYDNNEYEPDRPNVHNLNKIPKYFTGDPKIYRTNIFRNHLQVNELMQKVNQSKLENTYKQYKTLAESVNRQNPPPRHEVFGKKLQFNPVLSKISSSLYKDMNIQKNKLVESILKEKKMERGNCQENSKDLPNIVPHIYTTLLVKSKMDDIPLSFPRSSICSVKHDSISAEARHEKCLDKLLKLKYLISIDRKNCERTYLREFLNQNGIDGDNIDKLSLDYLSKFLRQEELKVDPNISIKDNLLNIMKGNTLFTTIPDIFLRLKKFRYASVGRFSNKSSNKSSTKGTFYKNKNVESENMKSYTVVPSNIKLPNQTKVTKLKDIDENKDEKDVLNNLHKELDDVKNKEVIERKIMIKKMNNKFKCISSDLSKAAANPLNCSGSGNEGENKFSVTIQNLVNVNSTDSESLEKKSEKNLGLPIPVDDLNNKFYYSRIDLPESLDYEKFKNKKKLTEYIVLQTQRKKEIINDFIEKNASDTVNLGNSSNNGSIGTVGAPGNPSNDVNTINTIDENSYSLDK